MATLTPNQAACHLKNAGATKEEAKKLLSVIPGESGFREEATNPESGACGIWQILPHEPGCESAATAAPIALRKLRTQGLGAWSGGVSGNFDAQVEAAWGGDCQGVAASDTSGGKSGGSGSIGLADAATKFFGSMKGLLEAGMGLGMLVVAGLMIFSSTPAGKAAGRLGRRAAEFAIFRKVF